MMRHYEYVKSSLKEISEMAETLSLDYEQQVTELQYAMQNLRDKLAFAENLINEQSEEIKSLRLVLSWLENAGISWKQHINDEMLDYLQYCQEARNDSY